MWRNKDWFIDFKCVGPFWAGLKGPGATSETSDDLGYWGHSWDKKARLTLIIRSGTFSLSSLWIAAFGCLSRMRSLFSLWSLRALSHIIYAKHGSRGGSRITRDDIGVKPFEFRKSEENSLRIYGCVTLLIERTWKVRDMQQELFSTDANNFAF